MQKKGIYTSGTYEGYFSVVGALVFLIAGVFGIAKNVCIMGLPLFGVGIYSLYRNPLLVKVYEDSIICYFIFGKKVCNYSEVKHAQICSTGKGDRGIELSFAYGRKCVMYYASLNECVYYLNFLNCKEVPIKRNKLWNNKIVGDSIEGYRLEKN